MLTLPPGLDQLECQQFTGFKAQSATHAPWLWRLPVGRRSITEKCVLSLLPTKPLLSSSAWFSMEFPQRIMIITCGVTNFGEISEGGKA